MVFIEVMAEVFDFLAAYAVMLPREGWVCEVETINNRLFEQLGVNPNRWDYLVDELVAKYMFSREIEIETKRMFGKIYTTPFVMLEGAEAGLELIEGTGVPIGIVTHADVEWTWRKYKWLDLARFVNRDEVYIVDPNGHKTKESWKEAMAYFGLVPDQCVVVGDSPRSDINPARELGVKHCILVEDKNQWSVHHQEVDEGVKRVSKLSEIPEILLG